MDRQSIIKPKTGDNEVSSNSSLKRQGVNSNETKNIQLQISNGLGAFNHNFSTIPVGLQTKLKIGEANDKYEQEADRVADQVMRMPEPVTNSLSTISNDANSIQRKVSQNRHSEISPEINSSISSLSTGGRAMTVSERNFFEPRFGANFSNVIVHNDTYAANAAQSINARAFTYKNHVVFGKNEYSDNSEVSKKLFAHELTHVLQQSPEQSTDTGPAIKNDASHQVQRDLLDDVLGVEGAQFVSDLSASVVEAPSHFTEILGELVDTILEHWIAFSATLLGIIAIEGVIAALAGAPEPTTATKWAALILQALMLLIIGAIAAVELGQVATHTYRWLTACWEARGDREKITEASKDFCRMLMHMVLLILALIGVRARVGAVGRAGRALRPRPVQRLPVPPTPNGMSLAEFGRLIGWGTRDAAARARINTITRAELVEGGVTRQMAAQWRDFYINEALRVPSNPSARGRSELMQHIVELL